MVMVMAVALPSELKWRGKCFDKGLSARQAATDSDTYGGGALDDDEHDDKPFDEYCQSKYPKSVPSMLS